VCVRERDLYAHTDIYARFLSPFLYTYIRKYIRMYVHTYVCTYVCMYIHAYIRTGADPEGAATPAHVLERGDHIHNIFDIYTYIQVRILKALLHPHIIRLYEVVEEPYRRLIMMEYSAGINSPNLTP
jgi:hypothetical protein